MNKIWKWFVKVNKVCLIFVVDFDRLYLKICLLGDRLWLENGFIIYVYKVIVLLLIRMYEYFCYFDVNVLKDLECLFFYY